MEFESFFRSILRVIPSEIRTEADEVTYNLHILLRYELEKTWDTGRRLVTWASRDRTYAPRQPAAPPEDVYAMNERLRRESQERIARKYGTNGQEGQS